MLERLDFWIAVLTLGALAWYELRLSRFVRPFLDFTTDVAERGKEEIQERRRRRTIRLTPRPIRGNAGRFEGSLPAVQNRSEHRSEPELRSESSSALESDGTTGTTLPPGTISPEEAALIGLRLGRGMSSSDVAKSLPGYSARKYKEYKEKVLKIEFELAKLEPVEAPQETA